jgi:hypothetical protein
MKIHSNSLTTAVLTLSLGCAAFNSHRLHAMETTSTDENTQSEANEPDIGGPPPNLKSGPFRSVVESMWLYSARFRSQCQRLALAPRLVVTLFMEASDMRSSVRATTEMSRKDGVPIKARIIIRRPSDSVELIAHEIEPVIEQLDGVVLAERAGARSAYGKEDAYESPRAREAGLLAAREVRENKGRVVANVTSRTSGQVRWTPHRRA